MSGRVETIMQEMTKAEIIDELIKNHSYTNGWVQGKNKTELAEALAVAESATPTKTLDSGPKGKNIPKCETY